MRRRFSITRPFALSARSVALSLVAISIAKAALAQSLLYIEPLVENAPYVGLGDTNADGHGDYLGPSIIGTHVFSGRDRSILWTPPLVLPNEVLIGATRLRDLDGDNVDELALGIALWNATPSGEIRIHSGRTGALVRTCLAPAAHPTIGYLMRNAGDVDADGFDDIIASRGSFHMEPAAVVVYSSATTAILHSWYPASHTDGFGHEFAGVGDVNHDGFDDLLFSSPLYAIDTFDSGKVELYSGFDGSLLTTWLASSGNYRFGTALAALGDINGDGTPDFAASSIQPWGPVNGRVRAFSGASGEVLWQVDESTAHFYLGTELTPIRDYDGDGTADLVAGAGYLDSWTCRMIRLISGRTGEYLSPTWGLGNHTDAIVNLDDLNGDRFDEIGAWVYGHGQYFLVLLLGWPPMRVFECDQGQPNPPCDADIYLEFNTANTASLTTGNGLSMFLRPAPAGSNGTLLWSTQATSMPFEFGRVCIGSPRRFHQVQNSGGTVPCGGEFWYTIDAQFLQSHSLSAGTTIFAQALFRAPQSSAHAFTLSKDVFEFTVVP